MGLLREVYYMYTPRERRNIAIYIAGIMLYKMGLEFFNGSIITLATDRFRAESQENAFGKVGALVGLNQAMQCIGSILIAPLIKRFNTRSILSVAILGFGLLTIILLVADAATGGNFRTKDGINRYGSYTPNAIFPVYCATGVTYGMVELIRRVIPRDIVGGHVIKLRRMDAVVHILYEVSGTAGALLSSVLIRQLGNNYSFILTPICFMLAGATWYFVSANLRQHDAIANKNVTGLDYEDREERVGFRSYFVNVWYGFANFGHAVYLGATIVFTSRKFIWLVPGYAFALVGHRYLENNLANIVAKQVFQESSYQQIVVGGSNFGELLGAVTVFLTAQSIPTPIPFIRLDALMLLIVWYIPYWYPAPHKSIEAWKMAASYMPIAFGWAAGDVSLAAYIQSSLARVESRSTGVSALGAVMSFLYVTYIVTYAIISPVLGTYVDRQIAKTNVHDALWNVGGFQFTILGGVILLSTFIPRGAFSLNPHLLEDEKLDEDIPSERSSEELQPHPPHHQQHYIQNAGDQIITTITPHSHGGLKAGEMKRPDGTVYSFDAATVSEVGGDWGEKHGNYVR